MTRICLGYGSGTVDLEIGPNCEVVLPNELPPAGPDEIDKALDNPINADLAQFEGCKSASILVSDPTRPAPSYKMLPPLVKRLRAIGIDDLLIVFGLGTHRRMTADEEQRLLGDCISMPHIQHDRSRCIDLGSTSRGTPVEILEDVALSDLIIGTGNIEYHYYAGYSGGAKAVLPGVSSERSITINHELMRDPLAASGHLDSPVRVDMEEAAEVAGLDFILNVVQNSKKEVVRAVAGDFIDAHRAGAGVVDAMYCRAVEPAEIVIVCAGGRPKDINLFQAHKALDNAKEAAVPGGTIILVAECSEGFGHPVFERWVREAESAEDCVERFGKEYEFGGHKAALIAKESLNHELILVSSMPGELAEMSFFKRASSLDQAVVMAREAQGKDARMIVMPYGNLTLATRKT
ncbi:MAG TPA: nickel-dependent lactate racemase [Methanotrichaceae archaeon]|nr:nickel-dependent lactate racemase [Methanotrichaceae archaeon]